MACCIAACELPDRELSAPRSAVSVIHVCRVHQSTEVALLKVIADILLVLDSGHMDMPSLLDLSALFEAVELQICIFI